MDDVPPNAIAVTEADLVAIGNSFQSVATFDAEQTHRHQLVATAISVLRTVQEDAAATVIEAMAVALVGAIEDVRAYRDALIEALTLAHTQHAGTERMRAQMQEQMQALRQELREARERR